MERWLPSCLSLRPPSTPRTAEAGGVTVAEFVTTCHACGERVEVHAVDCLVGHPSRRSSWTATDLIATEFPEPRFAVPGLIPEGLTLFAGAPKLGKSWLGLGLGIAVASGGRALGSVPVE